MFEIVSRNFFINGSLEYNFLVEENTNSRTGYSIHKKNGVLFYQTYVIIEMSSQIKMTISEYK